MKYANLSASLNLANIFYLIRINNEKSGITKFKKRSCETLQRNGYLLIM